MEMVKKQAEVKPKKFSPRKRIKSEEEEKEKDRISGLPDCLLVEILSRLPTTKDAIRTGTLSKRWKHVWTCVFNLTFHFFYDDDDFPLLSNFVSSIDKTLTQCRQLKLNKFQLITAYYTPFVSQINNWIRYAFDCNVEHLSLRLWPSHDLEVDFPLHEFFFINSCFRELKVASCVFNPTGAISWNRLKSLCLSRMELDEDLIENILSGSPLLETLELQSCYGYTRLDITSKSVKNLIYFGYTVPDYSDDRPDIIEINAPYISSLAIKSSLNLWKLLLVDVSSLVKAELCYKKVGYRETTPKKAEEEMLRGFILNLRHVKENKIGEFCLKALSRLKAKGFVFLSNLKVSDVTSPEDSDDEELLYPDEWFENDSLELGEWFDSI